MCSSDLSIAPGRVGIADGREVTAARVIVATDGPAAAGLVGERVVDRGSLPVGAVWFAAPESPVAGRLIVLDGARSGPALNVAVMSDVAPSYVTAEAECGPSLVVAACPGVDTGEGATSDDDLVAAVRRQLRAWWGPVVDHWTTLRVDRIHHGQPDHRPPFVPRRSQSLGGGVFVCGDHRDTPSIQGALFSGRRCAAAVLAD